MDGEGGGKLWGSRAADYTPAAGNPRGGCERLGRRRWRRRRVGGGGAVATTSNGAAAEAVVERRRQTTSRSLESRCGRGQPLRSFPYFFVSILFSWSTVLSGEGAIYRKI
jgi:hypothetical protein